MSEPSRGDGPVAGEVFQRLSRTIRTGDGEAKAGDGELKTAVIIDGVRTPTARAHPETGYFRNVRADDLAAHAIAGLLRKTGIDPALVESVYLGCVQQQGEQGFNVARSAALMAGLPVDTPAATINRLCASGLSCINVAARAIMTGGEDVHIVGGVEHMGHYPIDKDFNPSPRVFFKNHRAAMMMGITAEYLARKYEISREAQDHLACRSHQLAHAATSSGRFDDEIVPTWGLDEQGRRELFRVDQTIRSDTSLAALSALSPAFDPQAGTITAGNSSPLSVGASALLMMSEDRARELGLTPKARICAMAVAGVEPCEMGIGPVKSTARALQRAGLTMGDIDAIELNEAFAAQALAVIRLAEFDVEKVNTWGGAIALGHALGSSGARLMITLVHRMSGQAGQLGLATLCVGGGQGETTIVESGP